MADMMTRRANRRELTLWEKSYLPEIFRGVRLTSWHFFRNMFFHTLHLFGLFRRVAAAVTVQYPEQRRELPSRLRTRHRLTKREDESPRCVACMLCETVCPARCIYIVAKEHPDPNIEKAPASFDIDLGKCVYCGFCVEVCPEDAIRMDTQIQETAGFNRHDMQLDMNELLNPGSRNKGKKYGDMT
jgi:NADH-quinone oxidoreductase subunit I